MGHVKKKENKRNTILFIYYYVSKSKQQQKKQVGNENELKWKNNAGHNSRVEKCLMDRNKNL